MQRQKIIAKGVTVRTKEKKYMISEKFTGDWRASWFGEREKEF